MSKYFILRPIFASVIAIILVLAGLVALKTLPIAQYPDISPPTVTITATYHRAHSRRELRDALEDGRRADRGAAVGHRQPPVLRLDVELGERPGHDHGDLR